MTFKKKMTKSLTPAASYKNLGRSEVAAYNLKHYAFDTEIKLDYTSLYFPQR